MHTDIQIDTKMSVVIKRHNIRIWCHDCDMGQLQRVVWAGHGTRLLSEVSNQPVVRKFLEAVPYIMNTIREIHTAVVQNDLEGLMKHSGDPVPAIILSSRDANNMTVMHKAAGLGHGGILKYLTDRYPQGINDVDNDGRTPLHYAATVKDEKHIYDTLVSLGADESIVDNKGKTAGYYVSRAQDIDKNLLKAIPEAPRTPSSAYPSSWDWKLLDTEVITELNKKSRRRNFKVSTENISSNNNTATESTENRVEMKTSSTQELIKALPDLDDSSKPNKKMSNKQKKSDEMPKIDKDTEEEEEEVNDKNESSEQEKEIGIEDNAEHSEEHVQHVKENEDHIKENEEEAEREHKETISEVEAKEENIDNNEKELKNENSDHVPEKEISDSAVVINEKLNDKDTFIEDNKFLSHDNNSLNQEISNHDTLNEKNSSQEDNTEKNEISEQTQIEQQKEQEIQESDNKNANDSSQEAKDEIEKPEEHQKEDNNELEEQKEQDEENQHEEEKREEKEIQSNGVEQNKDTEEQRNDEEQDKKEGEPNEKQNMDAVEVLPDNASTEGNHNDSNEDDDDVQAHGDTQSEYSDSNLRSTAKMTDSSSAKRGNLSDGRSTQDSLIEGIVNGEAELDSQDASVTQRDGSVHNDGFIVENEIDPEVAQLINTANMEMLAALVLNGEGGRLLNRHSYNSELQAFLDNVPIYMKKIQKVHLAAREGNLRDLQEALDRRKFAIARDPVSPNGATPLHIATIFGKTNVIKYLGGRFPETLSAVDFEGRTALHYAAVLPDNGHYYNLLQQLGANAKDLDDNGHSAEEYHKNPGMLKLDQLTSDFGITTETVQEMMSDKVPEDRVSSRRSLDTPETLDTLERCYRLLASARPTRTPLSASSNRATPPLVLGRFLRKQVFDVIKYRVTKLDHDLFDVIWPAVKKLPDNRNIVQTVEEDFPGGIIAPDYYVYAVFEEFLTPLIKDLHNMNVQSELQLHPPSDFLDKRVKNSSTDSLVEINVDPNDDFVLSGTMECARNVEGFELPLNLSIGHLEEIERIITTSSVEEEFSKFNEQSNPEADQVGGTYYTLNEVLEKPSEIRATLASAGLLIALCDKEEIDDCTRLHGKHWPYGRGVYLSDDKTVAVWINVHDHLRVVTCTPADAPGEIGLPFSRMSHIMSYLHDKLRFVWDYRLGHLSSRPTFLGSAVRFSLVVNFPGLSKDVDNMKHLCAMRGLQYRETLTPDIARVSNYQCLGITEKNCFNDFSTAVSNLLHLEKDFSMQNSAHIAAMLSNIFRRKRSSVADLKTPEKQ
ncbi:Arginine kinase [Eumeta japonica]|uniref:Arginine kinase n=1 Tax=Eumeta variegata TaxID=151549 RepID=A0A4C1V6H6_EUMVA|nr:Arginine kinase [Eumeta japonica]